MTIRTIQLSGLSCEACKKVTEKKIGSIAGVTGVTVDLSSAVATIESDRDISNAQVKQALQGTHYGVAEQ